MHFVLPLLVAVQFSLMPINAQFFEVPWRKLIRSRPAAAVAILSTDKR
jgi:hypothetical protein